MLLPEGQPFPLEIPIIEVHLFGSDIERLSQTHDSIRELADRNPSGAYQLMRDAILRGLPKNQRPRAERLYPGIGQLELPTGVVVTREFVLRKAQRPELIARFVIEQA